MDAARATAERIAAERAANNKEVAPLFTVPSGGATSNNNGG